MGTKPPWADQVVEVSQEEARALAACGVKVYWDTHDINGSWGSLDIVLNLSTWDIEDNPADWPNGFWFILKEGEDDALH